ncbi:MAG: deoxyribodipyrimidine photo-lyase [Flavobacteriales bacterium]|nr:deoxyribodipyrimidine photo-lyase [Flavobacteriales bacterium]
MDNKEKINLFWFRRDLRLEDNTALNLALKEPEKVLPVFIFDTNILDELERNDPRVGFIHEQLNAINNTLKDQGASIKIYVGKTLEIWNSILTEFKVNKVFSNKDYEPYAIKRDSMVREFLNKNSVELISVKDQVIFEENEIIKDDGDPYTIFTPYKNKWLRNFIMPEVRERSRLNFVSQNYVFPSLEQIGFKTPTIKVPEFNLSHIKKYAENRNSPSMNKTTFLGPYLRFGTLSIRSLIKSLKPDDEVFLSELIWREFFMQILFHFPESATQNFKSKFDGIQWMNREEDFEKWSRGLTGYPMVDAGMRQLNETGFMHNRVRMVTASFLCKHLLTDWRIGEAYFAKKLLDYELSSNVGNWQWAAGTGCDAAPYFRVFNPEAQLKKFDEKGDYVRKWLPDLQTLNYPGPMVDHNFARKRALDVYNLGIQEKL